MKATKYNWTVALSHTLIGGLLIPIFILFWFAIAAVLIGGAHPALFTSAWFQLVAEAVQVVAVWVGASITSEYLAARYAPPDPKKFLSLSTIYLAAALVASFAQGALTAGASLPSVLIYAVGIPLSCYVFYVETKKKFTPSNGAAIPS